MRTRGYVGVALLATGVLLARPASALDPPHDATAPGEPFEQVCSTCHVLHGGYGSLLDASRGATVNLICESCHDGVVATAVLTHGSNSTLTDCDFCINDFEVACTNCHDPHKHEQAYDNDGNTLELGDAFIQASIRLWGLTCLDSVCDAGQHYTDGTQTCAVDESCPSVTCTDYEICTPNPDADELYCQCKMGFDASCTACRDDALSKFVLNVNDCDSVLCGAQGERCGHGECQNACAASTCDPAWHHRDSDAVCTPDTDCGADPCNTSKSGLCNLTPTTGDEYTCDCPIGTTGGDCSTCYLGFDDGGVPANPCDPVDCTVAGAGADCGHGGTCLSQNTCDQTNCAEDHSDVDNTCTAYSTCTPGVDCLNSGTCVNMTHDTDYVCNCPVGANGTANCGGCAAGFDGTDCAIDCSATGEDNACGYGGACKGGAGGPPYNEYATSAVGTNNFKNPTNALADDGAAAEMKGQGGSQHTVTVSGFPAPGADAGVVVWVEYYTDTPWGNDTYQFDAALDGATFDQSIVAPSTQGESGWVTASLDLGDPLERRPRLLGWLRRRRRHRLRRVCGGLLRTRQRHLRGQ